MSFQRGDLLPMTFTLTGGTGSFDMRVRSWTVEEDGLAFDVTCTAHSGRTARLRGKSDHKGSAVICFDLGNIPYTAATPNIRFGSKGVFAAQVSTTSATTVISIGAIITKVHYESGTEQELRWSVDWAEDRITSAPAYPS